MYLIEMKPIIEVNEDGTLSLPTEILEAIAPNRRFVVEVKDKTLILYPESQSQPFWVTATPKRGQNAGGNGYKVTRMVLTYPRKHYAEKTCTTDDNVSPRHQHSVAR